MIHRGKFKTWNLKVTNFDKGTSSSRWFKVTFSSPSWRSLYPWTGSLNHPEKVTKNCQVPYLLILGSWCEFFKPCSCKMMRTDPLASAWHKSIWFVLQQCCPQAAILAPTLDVDHPKRKYQGITPWKPWKWMVGRCISYWNTLFLGDMLVFRGVLYVGCVVIQNFIHGTSYYCCVLVSLCNHDSDTHIAKCSTDVNTDVCTYSEHTWRQYNTETS